MIIINIININIIIIYSSDFLITRSYSIIVPKMVDAMVVNTVHTEKAKKNAKQAKSVTLSLNCHVQS